MSRTSSSILPWTARLISWSGYSNGATSLPLLLVFLYFYPGSFLRSFLCWTCYSLRVTSCALLLVFLPSLPHPIPLSLISCSRPPLPLPSVSLLPQAVDRGMLGMGEGQTLWRASPSRTRIRSSWRSARTSSLRATSPSMAPPPCQAPTSKRHHAPLASHVHQLLACAQHPCFRLCGPLAPCLHQCRP
jgi:hypothetical protein